TGSRNRRAASSRATPRLTSACPSASGAPSARARSAAASGAWLGCSTHCGVAVAVGGMSGPWPESEEGAREGPAVPWGRGAHRDASFCRMYAAARGRGKPAGVPDPSLGGPDAATSTESPVSRILYGSLRGDHLTGAMVSHRLVATDPGVHAGRDTPLPLYAVLLRTGFGEPTPSPAPLVSSYLTVSPLPAAASPFARCAPPVGGLLSVPLSVGSRPPGVTRRPALWSSDFPHEPASAARCREASAHLARSPGELGILVSANGAALHPAPRSPTRPRDRCRRAAP